MADDHEQKIRELTMFLIKNPEATFGDYPEWVTWDDLAEAEARAAEKYQEMTNAR